MTVSKKANDDYHTQRCNLGPSDKEIGTVHILREGNRDYLNYS